MNVFGKAFIGVYPGYKAISSEVLEWKTSKNVKWAVKIFEIRSRMEITLMTLILIVSRKKF